MISEQQRNGLLNACKDNDLADNTWKTKYIKVGCHGGMMENSISGSKLMKK